MGLLLGASAVHAITFTGSSGSLAASADFTLVNISPGVNNLRVTLTNTSSADVLVPADVLTAVFFNVAGNPSLGSVSAILNAGSTVFYDPDGQPAGGVVGGEWAYANGLSQFGANSGISSSGFGIFGGATFPGPDLSSPTAVNGLNYGILSAGDNSATGNGGITGSDGLIKNSVVFTLSGFGSIPLSAITNVTFQYGTALSTGTGGEPSFPGEPGPGVADGGSTIILCGLAFSALAVASRRFRRKAV